MGILRLLIMALAAFSLLLTAFGHAGTHSEEEIRAEIAFRNVVAAHSKRAIDNCASSAASQPLRERALARRIAVAHTVRERRGLKSEHVRGRRDAASLTKWAAISHDQSTEGYTPNTPASTIFASNTTCVLVPETVIGPYYVDGELIRTDITDGQQGVPVHLDIQFVDVETCVGIPALLVDIWHCNSTGQYSGVAAEGQGGLLTTHGRGAQKTDADGVVQFDTLFPGHYTGRATHIHVMSTANATILPNNTFTGGTARHIGQMYFDEPLRAAIEALAPYSTNNQAVTTNAEDMLAPDEATSAYDPFLQYVLLGDSLSDGLLMWITIGLNASADYSTNVSPAAHYYEGGGEAVTGGGMGGEPGDPSPSGGLGALPPGGAPSGFAPPFANQTGVAGPGAAGPAGATGTATATTAETSLGALDSTVITTVSSSAAATRARRIGFNWL